MSESGQVDTPEVSALAPDDTAESTALNWRSRRLKPVWWIAAAAVSFLALWGWTELRLRAARAELEENAASRRGLEETIRRLRLDNEKLSATIQTFTAANTRAFPLVGQKAAPTATGRVFVDMAGRGHVYLYNLPKAPPDSAYYLWVVSTRSSRPERIGILEVDAAATAHASRANFPPASECRSVMVTLERRTGAMSSPRGPRILLSRS